MKTYHTIVLIYTINKLLYASFRHYEIIVPTYEVSVNLAHPIEFGSIGITVIEEITVDLRMASEPLRDLGIVI
jgi:hypothetical protein